MVSEKLSQLLKAPEGANVEFKEAKNSFDRKELFRYCIALANEGGGEFVLGVTDAMPAPKFRIYQDLGGKFFFAFIDATGEDLALSHKYTEKDSMLRRIERVMAECDSSVAMG